MSLKSEVQRVNSRLEEDARGNKHGPLDFGDGKNRGSSQQKAQDVANATLPEHEVHKQDPNAVKPPSGKY